MEDVGRTRRDLKKEVAPEEFYDRTEDAEERDQTFSGARQEGRQDATGGAPLVEGAGAHKEGEQRDAEKNS